MKRQVIACLIATGLGPSGAQAATITEDFDSGLSAYSLFAQSTIATSLTPTDFVGVDQDGANNYLRFDTGFSAQALAIARARRSIAITADTALLSFDMGFVAGADEPFASTQPSVIPDELIIGYRLSSGPTRRLARMRESGAAADPSGTAAAPVALTAPGDAFFDTGVTADLSGLIGQTIDLRIFLNSFTDNRVSSFGVDNITFSALPAAVPLPGGAVLLLGALGLAAGLRRRA